MEVAQREQRYPCPFIMTDAMDKEEGQSKMVTELSRNGAHHPSCVGDGKGPVTAWHMFLREYALAMWTIVFQGFTKPSVLSRSHDNFRIVVDEIFQNSSTK